MALFKKSKKKKSENPEPAVQELSENIETTEPPRDIPEETDAESPPKKKGLFSRSKSRKPSKEEIPPAIDALDVPEEISGPETSGKKKKAEKKGFFKRTKRDKSPDAEIAEEAPEPEVAAEADDETPDAKPEKKGFFKRTKRDKSPDAEIAEEAPEPEIAVEADDETPDTKPRKNGLFGRLKNGLSRTREILTTDIDDLFRGNRKIDDDLLDEIEELLITSDMGVQTTMELMERISGKKAKISSADDLKAILKEEICVLMGCKKDVDEQCRETPRVIMVLGVNGVGKTTTIGKLAARFSGEGRKVLVAAADTFRAAAVEQLAIWAERSGVDIVRHRDNADPAAVAFDGVEAGMARGCDVVIVDTAGRLHTKVNLMEELKKIQRAIAKKMPSAPHEVLLVLDATTGQNALSQARLFHEAMGLTGLILTKLDGTAKGGVVVSICNSLEIPLKYIGVGEGIEDLQKFDAEQFVNALFG